MFNSFPKSLFQIVAPDGSVRGSTEGIYTKKMVLIEDTTLVIQQGDELRRQLPNGTEEAFEVVDPVFYEHGVGGIKAHYQIQIKRKGTFGLGQGGHSNVNISGHNARVNIGSTDQSVNIAIEGDVFTEISAALDAHISDEKSKQELLAALEKMKNERSGSRFIAAYQNFISLAANHMSVIAPYLPALTKLLP